MEQARVQEVNAHLQADRELGNRLLKKMTEVLREVSGIDDLVVTGFSFDDKSGLEADGDRISLTADCTGNCRRVGRELVCDDDC